MSPPGWGRAWAPGSGERAGTASITRASITTLVKAPAGTRRLDDGRCPASGGWSAGSRRLLFQAMGVALLLATPLIARVPWLCDPASRRVCHFEGPPTPRIRAHPPRAMTLSCRLWDPGRLACPALRTDAGAKRTMPQVRRSCRDGAVRGCTASPSMRSRWRTTGRGSRPARSCGSPPLGRCRSRSTSSSPAGSGPAECASWFRRGVSALVRLRLLRVNRIWDATGPGASPPSSGRALAGLTPHRRRDASDPFLGLHVVRDGTGSRVCRGPERSGPLLW